MTFVYFDIWNRNASLRKLYTVTLTYFSKVKNWNRDLSTVADAHTSVTSARYAVLPAAANVNAGLTIASAAVLSSTLSKHELLLYLMSSDSTSFSFIHYADITDMNRPQSWNTEKI